MVIEGLVERKSWGDIAVDDIKVLNGLSMVDCKGEFIVQIPKFSSWSEHSLNIYISHSLFSFSTRFN